MTVNYGVKFAYVKYLLIIITYEMGVIDLLPIYPSDPVIPTITSINRSTGTRARSNGHCVV